MAVTLQLLRFELRLDDDVPTDAELTHLQTAAVAEVNRYAPDAPEEVKDRAVVLLTSALHEGREAGDVSRIVESGAAATLDPYRTHRAGVIE